jgi:hypothetical protein
MTASSPDSPPIQDVVMDAAQGRKRTLRRLVVLALTLNAVSALLFIFSVHRAVYDDPNNFPDVRRYAREGVSANTIRHHQNPTGPTSFIWMAASLRILGGDELRDARLASLLSWVLLGTGILFLIEWSSYPQLWYAAFLATLYFRTQSPPAR